jgi:hypothetical protein
LVSILTRVLSPPEDQLDDETKAKVIEMVKFIGEQHPSLVQGNEVLMKVVQS